MTMEIINDHKIRLNDLKFKKAFDIESKSVNVLSEELLKSIGGVYAVVLNSELLYVGVYGNTLKNRWINRFKNSKCVKQFRHFKGDMIQEMVKKSKVSASVYALPLNKIKKKFDNNEYIDQYSIESRLLALYNPPMNKHKTTNKRNTGKK